MGWLNKKDKHEQLKDSIKQAMLISRATGLTFLVNPVFVGTKTGGPLRGFWKMANKKAIKIEADEFRSLFENEKLTRGGTIVIGLSGEHTDEDVQRMETYVPDLINEILGEVLGRAVGWTIGNLGYGRYVAPNGETFDERSLTVTIRGLDTEQLREAASAVAMHLNQNAVLLNDDNTGETSLWSRKETRPDLAAKPEEPKGV